MMECVLSVFSKLRKNDDYKRLFSNFVSLHILQAINYILPLITFPYLVRVLGVEKFGLIAFATSTIGYFQIITDYGFNLSATREIAINRDNKQKVQEIFSAVMVIRFGLLFLSLILLTILVFSFERFRQDWELYYLTFLMVVGNVLFPVWFFHGLERMKYIAILNILAKGLFAAAIFIFVREQSDYWKVPLLNGVGWILAGGMSIYVIYKSFDVGFSNPSARSILNQLKEGWHIFVSTFSISLFSTTTFILGLFTNDKVVGYYAAAEKIIGVFKGLLVPASQSLYPYINKIVSYSRESGLRIIRKVLLVVAIFTFILSLSVFLFRDLIVKIVLGNGYDESILVLGILSVHPFLVGLSNVFGIQTMLVFNRKRAFQNILLIAGMINILLSLVLVPMYNHIGSAVSVTIVELFVTVSMFLYLQISGIKIFGGRNV